MRVGIIGGLDRLEARYRRLAGAAGHELVCHDGALAGRGTSALSELCERADVVVIVTGVNSHGAVQLARQRLRSAGRTPLLVQSLGLTRFATLLEALSLREERLERRCG